MEKNKMIISYETFIGMLNHRIESDGDENYNLLVNVINNPARYSGLFRLSNAKSKLIQNVTQSKEIKLGDFLEELITHYFDLLGYQNLDKNLGYDENGDNLNVDQIFINNNALFFIEQKIRDDHDSTKKRGQFQNFIKKVNRITTLYPQMEVYGSMWFIDPSLTKNRNYYLQELRSEGNDNLRLFYGEELFTYLSIPEVWNELVDHLTTRRQNNSQEVIEIPDFDTSDEIFEALVRLPNNLWNKLNTNNDTYKLLRAELFPQGVNLQRAKIARRSR